MLDPGVEDRAEKYDGNRRCTAAVIVEGVYQILFM